MQKISRRNVLVGAAAAAIIAPTLAAPAIATPVSTGTAITLLRENYAKQVPLDDDGFCLKVAEYMVHRRHIREGSVVSYPTNIIERPDGQVATGTVRSRAYRAEMAFYPMWQYKERYVDLIGEEIIAEQNRSCQLVSHATGNLCETFNYLPILPVRAVDPGTFEPKIAFKGKFFYVLSGTKTLSLEEERARTIRMQSEWRGQ